MLATHQGYQISDDRTLLDFATVHAWLTTTYWTPGVSRERVEQAARYSTVVAGAYATGGRQVAYCRAVSDRTRFAWLADVFVDPAHRGRGIARAMVLFLLRHPDLVGVDKWLLATRDAHSTYASLGFTPPNDLHYFMERPGPPPL
jgi:GNAT superfamily N-acetyltransferase